MIKLLSISLGIVFAVSTGVGFVLKEFIGFWEGFILAVIVQFIASYGIATFKNTSKETVEAVVDNSQQLIDLQTVEITCPCGNIVSKSPIFFGLDNGFVCNKCSSKFRVELSYEPVLVTEPLNIENAYNFLKSKEQV